MNKIVVICLCALFFLSQLKAQTSRVDQEAILKKKVNECLRLKSDSIKDSILIYAFNFQLDIIRDRYGKIKVNKITANDTLAHKLFPNYKQLSQLDYRFLGQNRRRFTLIIPRLVYFKNHNEDAMIRMDAALNAAYALYAPWNYDNERDKYDILPYRIAQQDKDKSSRSKSSDDYIFLPLDYIVILRTE